MSRTNCRFYENKFPEVDEVVMVNVQQIEEMGAYVKLLEYDNIEGMVLLSELSRRRIRSIQKLIRVGKNEVVVVLRVDKEKGYIDLSKRRVSSEEITKCEERYNKSKSVHSILRQCAEKFDVPLESLYEKIGWPLSRKYGHSYDAFKISITDDDVWNAIDPSIDQSILEELKAYISRRLTPQAIKCRADVTVSCFRPEGIDAIKQALRAAENLSNDQMELKAKLIAAPLYVLTTQSLDKQQGLDLLQNAIQVITTEIGKYDGICKVDMAPKAITATEDQKLKELIEAKARGEISDSEDDEDDEEEDN
ncbi:translation initiation factor eIF2 subunit alpha [Saccharomycopsis crataegensis]|uniref:Translation initiation factor eIF2 subunit alpha n=1 Tax=Saccharomycopsis crataegensis TaxID=43959 RepID=A0AAV5QKV1_9ASCO|nr:translation initiation factor eIF2 subunit alpha [Saccharomycopsis crataegensis]